MIVFIFISIKSQFIASIDAPLCTSTMVLFVNTMMNEITNDEPLLLRHTNSLGSFKLNT